MELVALVSPAVTHLVVKEGNDAVLPCSLSTTSIKQELFDWKKDGQREVFMYDRGSIYDEKRSDPILRPRPIPGAAPKPSFTILGETQDGVQLQCEVHGASPKPVVQWQDRAGNIIPAKEPQVSERGGSYDIILQTTVCSFKTIVTILDEANDWALLQCEVHGASPKPVVQWQDSDGNIIPAEEPQVSERGGSYDIILQTTVTKTDSYHCVATQEEIKHTVQAETHVYISGPAVTHLVVKEGNDAVLPCSLSTTSIKQELFDWKKDGQREVFMYDRGSIYDEKRSGQDEHFKGRVFHFPEHLESGNASIVIRDTKVKTKTDPRCSSKPSFTILGETQDGVQLQCEVHGASPKPVVQWQDRAGNIIPAKEPQVSERGGSYDIILQTTVSKTDYYHCVATQEEINHQIYTETYVLFM
ncbi:hypothetical protein INR49_022833, partial [Caranx melampygus]